MAPLSWKKLIQLTKPIIFEINAELVRAEMLSDMSVIDYELMEMGKAFNKHPSEIVRSVAEHCCRLRPRSRAISELRDFNASLVNPAFPLNRTEKSRNIDDKIFQLSHEREYL